MKFVKYLATTLFSLLVLLTLLLPALVSTNAGKEILLARINQKNPQLKLSIEKLALSWFGKQKVEGLKVEERSGLFTFSAASFTSSASLLRILWSRPDLRHPFPLKFSGDFTLSGGRLNILKTDFEDLEAELLIPDTKTSLLLRAWGKSVQESEKGNFSVCTLFSDLKSQNPTLDIQVELLDLPIKAVDQIATIFNPRLSGLFVEGIGPKLNLLLHGDISKEKLDCDFKIDSSNLKGSIETKWQGGRVTLANPGNIQFLITPLFADKIAAQISPLQGLKLKKEAQAALSLRSLALPLTEKGLDIDHATFELGLELSQTTLLSTLTTQEISLDTLSASLSTNQFQEGVDVDMSTVTKIDGMQSRIQVQGKLENLIGDAPPSGRGKVQAEELSLILLDQMFKQEGKLVDFLGKTLDVELDFVIAEKKKQATLQFSTPDVSCTSFTFTWNEQKFTFDVTGTSIAGSGEGSLQKEGELLKLQVDAFFPTFAYIGPELRLKLLAKSMKEEKSVQILATSAQLNAQVALTLKDDQLFLSSARTPIELYFTLTKEGYAALDRLHAKNQKGSSPYELKEPSVFSLTLSHFNCPLSKKKTSSFSLADLDLIALEMKGEVAIDKFAFLEKGSGRIVKFNRFQFQFQKTPASGLLNWHLDSTLTTRLGSLDNQEQGVIKMDGKIDQLFTDKGLGKLPDSTLDIGLTLKALPSSVFDILARGAGISSPLSPLFGESVNAECALRLTQASGPVSINLHSPNTRFSLSGSFKAGILSLLEPIYAQVKMTPELSKYLLQEINPLSISEISAQHPLTLEIAPQGFSLTLFPFDVNKLVIPKARIELGQILCHNEGALNITLGLLKSQQLAKEKQLQLWFAPIDLHVQGGVADIERTEILIGNTFEIASWGKVDFAKDYVDMILGLTAQCLNKAFGIKNLPSDYVMQIPMKGKMNDVQLNTGTATTKIAALMLWQQKGLGGSGGLLPGIAGDVLGKLGVLPDLNSSAPPAKHPFPWESNKAKKETTEKSSFKKKNKIKKEDKPLKQLLKVLR